MSQVWYVTGVRDRVDWDTAISGGRATVTIYRLVRVAERSEYRSLFAREGSRPTLDALFDARLEESPDPVPPAPPPPYVPAHRWETPAGAQAKVDALAGQLPGEYAALDVDGDATDGAGQKLLTQAAGSATYGRLGQAFSGLKHALDRGRECAVVVLGDSTGNDSNEWPYLLCQSLAASFPAHTVRHWLWNDTTQTYDRPTTVQTGTAGRRSVAYSSGYSLEWFTGDVTTPTMSGDLDLRANLALTSWSAPSANGTIVARQGTSGNYGFRLNISSAGNLYLSWSTDGTTFVSSVFGGKPSSVFANGAEGWVRATLDVDDGAGNFVVKFYTSSDGFTWTQLGTTITTAGTTSVFQATAQPFEFGSRAKGGEILPGATFYEVQIRDGINGPLVCPPNTAAWTMPSTVGGGFTGTLAGAPVLDMFNGSKPGANIGYLNDTTRRPKLAPLVGPLLVLLSDSHNENETTGPAFFARYKGWVDAVSARLPGVAMLAMTQNPRIAPADNISNHDRRRLNLMSLAARLGIGVVDTYQAFLDDPAGLPALTNNTDGIHPTTAGSLLWHDTVRAAFDAAP